MSVTFLKVPVDSILLFLWEQEQLYGDQRAPWAWWWRYEDIPAITEAMPPGTTEEDARAVMQYLIDMDLVMGCTCDCRGDFELTTDGRDRVYELQGGNVSNDSTGDRPSGYGDFEEFEYEVPTYGPGSEEWNKRIVVTRYPGTADNIHVVLADRAAEEFMRIKIPFAEARKLAQYILDNTDG